MSNPLIDCWEAVYLRHRSGLFSLALSILGQRQLAEDAVHEAFVSLCRVDNIPLDPAAYVYRSVRNVCIDIHRKKQREHRLAESIFVHEDSACCSQKLPAERMMDQERNQQLMDAVDRLDENSKELVVLKQFSGLTFQQISDVTGVAMKTVATRYRRVIMKLKEELDGKL